MIKKVLGTVAATLLLCGCSTHVVSSNPRNVVVESHWKSAETAQQLADAECAKYKRFAKMTLKPDFTEPNYAFECVD